MTHSFKLFLLALGASAVLFAGANYLDGTIEEFFVWQAMQANAFAAQGSIVGSSPVRDWAVDDLTLGAEAAFSVYRDADGREHILFAKNSRVPLPVASLTKLMTAHVAHSLFDPFDSITIEELLPEDNGTLVVGDTFEVRDLYYLLLVSSNNTAAQSLAERYGSNEFVALMNLEARTGGMQNTVFVNATGLDPDADTEASNVSSARDIAHLARMVFTTEVFSQIVATPGITLYAHNTMRPYTLLNTNQLLSRSDVRAGKTGWTPRAQGCLVVLHTAPDGREVVSVLLGSRDRFSDMEKLINWTREAYTY